MIPFIMKKIIGEKVKVLYTEEEKKDTNKSICRRSEYMESFLISQTGRIDALRISHHAT